MLYPKWMEELDQLDTPAIREKRRRDHWYTLELSCAYIIWKPIIWIPHVIYTLFLLSNMAFFFMCDLVTIFKTNDLAIIGQCMNYASLILICMVIIVMGNVDRKSLIGMFETCVRGFYDYKDEDALPDDIQKLSEQFATVNMLYPKWMEELDHLDTPAVRQMRRRDYWYTLELSCIYLVWKPKIWIPHLIYTLFLLSNMAFFFLSDFVTIFKTNDFAIIGQCINYAALILICMVIVVMANVDRRSLIGMFETCVFGFYDYKDEEALPDDIQKLTRQFGILKKIVTFAIPLYMFFVAGLILLADGIDASFNYEISNATYVDGIYFKLPVKMWLFYTIETDLDWWIMLGYMSFNAANVALVGAVATFLMFYFGLELILQQNILRTACVKMDKRADTLYKKRYGKNPPNQPLKRSDNKALMECYQHCVKQVVQHHRILLRFAEDYMTIINWPTGIVVFNGSISIAMSALTFMQGKGRPSMIVTGTFLLVGVVCCMFLVCELGQTIKNLSEDIFDAIYSFKWINCSKEVLKDVLIMKNILRRPIVLMASSLTPLDRDTFSTVMSTAYSYMNVLRARQEEGN